MIYVRITRPWFDERKLKPAGYELWSYLVEFSKSVHPMDDAERLCPCCRARIKMFPKSRFSIPNPKKYRDMASSEDEYTFVSSDFKQFQDFIVQSDHMWGVDKFRYQHIIIGNQTFEKMKEYGLRGIDIWDVFE